jgi:NSS family neurotransmitter:Na+ symporter
MNESRGFASRIGFILSMAGFCIGIGNLWKFPYVVGANGGGAFLIVYLIAVVVIGIPLFMVEVTLGRTSELSPIAGMKKLEGGKTTGWSVIGWVETIAIFLICSFSATIIGGWSPGYIVKVASGSLRGLSPAEIGQVFGEFAGSGKCMLYGLAVWVLLYLCLVSGVKKGVEKVCSILLPTLIVIMIVLAIYSNTLDGASEGLKWYLTPDFSKINMSVIGAAVTQVFFSIGIGMCVAYVYGSYIGKQTALPSSLTLTAVLDTLVAFLSGMICTPALFAFGIEPTAGPSLLFITLPQLFNEMGAVVGTLFGTLFMLCVFAAGYTSLLGGAEALVATLVDSKGYSRKKAAIIVLVSTYIVGMFVTMSFGDGPVASLRIMGFGLFDFIDFLAEGVGLTVAAVMMYIYAIWHWGFKKFQTEVNIGDENSKFKIGNGFGPYYKFVVPVILAFAVYGIFNSYLGG